MILLKIVDIKTFMNKLLKDDTFDHFLLYEASIKTSNSYHIDGKLHREFYNQSELEIMEDRSYSYWLEQKHLAFEMIKGNKTPLAFKVIFMLSPSNIEKLVLQNNLPINETDISGLFLNIHYENKELTCTSGTSLKIFTMDKTLDHVWESNLKKFFKLKEIPFELD